MEQDVVDDVTVDGAVDDIADGATDDQREADSGEHLVRWGFQRQIEHKNNHYRRNRYQAGVAQR